MMLQDILLSSTHMLEWAIPESYSYLFNLTVLRIDSCVKTIKKTRPVKTKEVSVVCFLYQGIIDTSGIQWRFFLEPFFYRDQKDALLQNHKRCFLVQNVFGRHEVS